MLYKVTAPEIYIPLEFGFFLDWNREVMRNGGIFIARNLNFLIGVW